MAVRPRTYHEDDATTVSADGQLKHSLNLKKAMRCPISLQRMVNPMVDQCGHSFDSTSIHMLFRGQDSAPCPFSRETIFHKDMRPNYQLKTIIDAVRAEALPNPLAIAPRVAEQVQDQMRASSVRLEAIEIQIREMDRRDRIHRAQINNIRSMSFSTRLGLVFRPNNIDRIMNRGISAEDITFMNPPPSRETLRDTGSEAYEEEDLSPYNKGKIAHVYRDTTVVTQSGFPEIKAPRLSMQITEEVPSVL